MSKILKIVIVLVLIAAVAGGGWWLAQENGEPRETERTERAEPEATEAQPDEEVDVIAATINYSDNGFAINAEGLSAGDNIQIINGSSQTLDFASDPHPAHTDNQELNLGHIPPGEDRIFSISQAGTWGFHNHINPDHSAVITVEE